MGRGYQTLTTAGVKAGTQKKVFGEIDMVLKSICLTVMKRAGSKLGMTKGGAERGE